MKPTTLRRSAYSIIELLVACSILVILISLASIYIGSARKNSRDSQRLSDVLLISKAIDQYSLSNRGGYPSLSPAGTDDCVSNLTGLDLSSFSKFTIPVDPLIVKPASTCANALSGYTFHRWNLVTPNFSTRLSTFYTLEVGLENASKPGDDSLFLKPSETKGGGYTTANDLQSLGSATRYIYLLNGPYCVGSGSPATNNCY